MKVLDIKRIHGCLEGRNVWDFLLDGSISKDFISHLGNFGKLIYQDQMKKPYFTIIVRGKYTIKGSETNKTFRVILPENANIELLEEIKDNVSEHLT
jgi:hypothetical protein